MHKTGCVPLFFLLDDEHGVVIRRIVKHELEWRPPAMMAIEDFLCENVCTSRERRKMRGNENGKTRIILDIPQVHSSDFLTSPIVDCQVQVLWQRTLLLLLSGQTFIWSVRYCFVCPTMKMNMGFLRRRTVELVVECIPPAVMIIEAFFFMWKGEYIEGEEKNARKREWQNENQP